MKGDLFRTREPELDALWDRLLTLQADVTAGFELPGLFTDPAWHRARTVVNLGSGNGAFLQRVAETFPDKHYVGVDSSAELVEAAMRAKRTAPRVEYRCGDLLDLQGSYDYALLRLVVRHVADHGRLVDGLEQLLPDGGGVLLSDSDVDGLFFWPEAPALTSVFRRLNDSVNVRFGDRGDVLEHFLSRVRASPCLRIVRTRTFTVPSSVAANLEWMREQYASTLELVRRTTDWDLSAVHAEWRTWRDLPVAFTQFGMTQVHIGKVGGRTDASGH